MDKIKYYDVVDFVKGMTIVFVILLHILSINTLNSIYACFHIWQAVPLFVLVSFYLLHKKLNRVSIKEYYSISNIVKTLKRIVLPFALVEGIILAVYLTLGSPEKAIHLLKIGGDGPGAYYPYIYIQLWILTPLILSY